LYTIPQAVIVFDCLHLNAALGGYVKRYGRDTVEIRMSLSMAVRYENKKQKIEALTANYPIADKIKPE
jgi:hypothetical protein